jgi:hypothetical protein
MKKFQLFLALSLAANAAFLATFFVRPRPAATPAPVAAKPSTAAAATGGTTLTVAQRTALASGDLAALKAAGLPDDVARDLLIGRAYARLQARLRAANPRPPQDERYWRNQAPWIISRAARAEMNRARHEFNEALQALGETPPEARQDTRYDYLAPAKADQLRRIARDYTEMTGEILSDMNGIQLPSDREKLRLLREEQQRDIAAALTPEEYEEYQLHSSATANYLRARYGDAIQSEEEYRKIFSLQKAFEDRYGNLEAFYGAGPVNRETMQARQAAEAELSDEIRAAIAPENQAAFNRALDSDYRTLSSVTRRLNLPETTADTVLAMRDDYTAQSQQIAQDATLTPEDRRARLQALATQAGAALQTTLGAEGAAAYGQRASWLNRLKSGSAIPPGSAARAGGMIVLPAMLPNSPSN